MRAAKVHTWPAWVVLLEFPSTALPGACGLTVSLRRAQQRLYAQAPQAGHSPALAVMSDAPFLGTPVILLALGLLLCLLEELTISSSSGRTCKVNVTVFLVPSGFSVSPTHFGPAKVTVG